MSKFRDRVLTCIDCGRTFAFTVRDQEFFADRGYSEPRRCPDCRAARKSNRAGGGDRPMRSDRPERQMYDIICARCGKPAQVPFQPRNDRPVYCRDCYDKEK